MWADTKPSEVITDDTEFRKTYAQLWKSLEAIREENNRLLAENRRLIVEIARNQDEIKGLEGKIASKPKIEPGLAMLGSINILDVQNLDEAAREQFDAELVKIRDAILYPAGHEGEYAKRDSIPARVENLFDRLDIRYDVKDGAANQWLSILDQSRPKKDRFLDLILHRRWFLQRPDHNKGGFSTYRLIFWLNIVYRLLDMRGLW